MVFEYKVSRITDRIVRHKLKMFFKHKFHAKVFIVHFFLAVDFYVRFIVSLSPSEVQGSSCTAPKDFCTAMKVIEANIERYGYITESVLSDLNALSV